MLHGCFSSPISFSEKAKDAELWHGVTSEQRFSESVRVQFAEIHTGLNNQGNLLAHTTEKSRDFSGS